MNLVISIFVGLLMLGAVECCGKDKDCGQNRFCGGRLWGTRKCVNKKNDGERCGASGLVENSFSSCRSGWCTCSFCGKKVRKGLRCSNHRECQSGRCTVYGNTNTCKGVCVAFDALADGKSCLTPESCLSQSCICGVCTRKGGAGIDKRCSKNNECKSRWCQGESYTFSCYGTCKSKIPDGHKCVNGDGNGCTSGQCTCSYCGSKMSDGYKCATNDNCKSGWCEGWSCNGICRSKTPYGHKCVNGDGNSCGSGQCTCGYCGKKMSKGYKCSTNDNCLSGDCKGWITAGCSGTCK